MDLRDLLRNLEPKENGSKTKAPKPNIKDSKLSGASWHSKQKKNSNQVRHNLKKRMGI